MKPLVSIIVPVYNVKQYLIQCLESLKNQSYENIEIIIVDDGSTDGSGKICDKFAENEARARVYHKKNGGLSDARNYGIRKARGSYICLVDSDDYVKDCFISDMVTIAQKEKIDIVVCGYNNIIPKSIVITGKDATIRLLTQQNNIDILAWNKLYKRKLFIDINYPKGSNYEDNLTTYKLLSRAKSVAYLKKSLYIYRERSISITKSDSKEEKLKVRERAAQEAISFFKNEQELRNCATIALLTAKLAFIDFAIKGEVDKKYLKSSIVWVRDNKDKLLSNNFLSQKLQLYIHLICLFEAKPYIWFRRIWHE